MNNSHHSWATGMPAWVGSAWKLRDRRRASICALSLLALVYLIAAFHPRHVSVNGATVRLPRAGSAFDCARAARLSLAAGDLLDVHGNVLTPGGGLGPTFYRNGEICGPSQRLKAGDKLDVTPGQGVTEPVKETATLLPYRFETVGPGGAYYMVSQPGLVGIRRVERGVLSGRVKSVEVAEASPAVVYEGHKTEPGKRVALTFDDGPTQQFTPQVLDILKRYDARATFFVICSLTQYWPQLVRREVAEGHEVGIHTWDHANLTHLSVAAIESDIGRCEHTLRPLVGAPIRWVRPPYGAMDSKVRNTLSAMGYHIALWSVDTNDWQRPGSSVIISRVLNGVHNGAIVLMHDGGGPRAGTVAAVQSIIPALQKAGYELVTLSELTGDVSAGFGGMVVRSADGAWRVKLAPAGLKVTVDDEPVTLAVQPIEIDGDLLLPAAPFLRLLGAHYEWDQTAQLLRVHTVNGTIVLRLNSRRVEINGEQARLRVPPVLYRGESMIPLWALLNYCGAQARYDALSRTLDIDTPYRGTELTEPAHKLGLEVPEYMPVTRSWEDEYRV